MDNQDFTTIIVVDQTPKEVFEAITNVRGWWSEEIEGDTAKLNDEFKYHYKDIHVCKMKLVEVVPNKRIVWDVLENHFKFTVDKTEWVGTKVIFEISTKNNKTAIRFTHKGLVPDYECYNICVNGWTKYINGSLHSLITTGNGQPNLME